jgi:hypothetical protein
MSRLSESFEIKETDKENGILKPESINNFKASFSKKFIDLLEEGYIIKLSNFQSRELEIEINEEIEVYDEEKQENIKATKKVRKPAFNCSCNVLITGKKLLNAKKEHLKGKLEVEIDNGKIEVKKADTTSYRKTPNMAKGG